MKSAVVYQGLFLIAFGLYVQERLSKRPEKAGAVVKAGARTESAPRQDETGLVSLVQVYRDFQSIPAVRASLSGLKLSQNSSEVSLVLESDELYRTHAVEVEPVWHSTLDEIGTRIYSKLGSDFEMRIEVDGDRSSERAGWVLGYFENHFQAKPDRKIQTVGHWGDLKAPRIMFRVTKLSN